jgi:hypothetical protein
MFLLHFLSYVFLYIYENKYLLFTFIGLRELFSSNLILFFNTNITDFILYILLQFYFRVPVALRYPREVLFWLSRKIFKSIVTHKAILYNYNVLYYIQHYHSFFNIFFNNEFIPSILFSFIFLGNSFLNMFFQNTLYCIYMHYLFFIISSLITIYYFNT